jgi:hypothetical protein
MRMLSSTDSLTGESAVAQRILSDAGYGDTADEAEQIDDAAVIAAVDQAGYEAVRA